VTELDPLPVLDKKRKHSIDVVVDRLVLAADSRSRLADSVETALRTGKGRVRVEVEGHEPRLYSEERSCPRCKIALPELTPQMLSYNSPLGMCPACSGLGSRLEADPDRIVPNPELSIDQGAIEPWRNVAESAGWTGRIVKSLCKDLGIPRNVAYKKLSRKQRDLLLWGSGDRRIQVTWSGKHSKGSWAMRWEGLGPQILRRYEQTSSEQMRQKQGKYLHEAACHECAGSRLRPEARAVSVEGKTLTEVTALPISEAHAWFSGLKLAGVRAQIAAEVLKEVRARLGFLVDVGLGYLTLDRATATLSGGEAQRIRLAAQLGSELSGVMYVLDEPSIGLHPRDGERLLSTLARLRDLGNSVLVVEHDADTIRAADHVVDFGPGAGKLGGRVVAEGPPSEIARHRESLTGLYLSGERQSSEVGARRHGRGELVVRGARENNLRGIDVPIPLGVLCAVTGVSGAGKSSLVSQILVPALRRRLHDAQDLVGAHDAISGIDQLDKVVVIDQDPIGRTPRSNPATYTKAFDLIRDLFAELPEARAFGYGPGRFSFNVKGGRCEACEGGGVRGIEMHFLPDVYVTCETCRGKRYNDATLRITYRGKSIAEVLDLSISDAFELFRNVPQLARILATLDEVGLGYVALGQPATTLSGGEAQRVKLARELARRDTGRTLYVLDEPTTGLHFDDVRKLLSVLARLVEAGNSVLVVEHNLDVIAVADYVIDLGPEGGDAGGALVARGTPEQIARIASSHTGRCLAQRLAEPTRRRRQPRRNAATRVAALGE
jgi:excinuclease ABC subunit A